jgi:hypothetical protein
MACQLTRGFAIDCNDAVSGIKNIYIGSSSAVGAVTTNTTGEITAFAATGQVFYKYELKDQNADWVSTPQVSEQSGTAFYQNVVNFTLTKMQQAKRNEVKLLASGTGCVVICEGWDGKFWVHGAYNGAKWTGGEMQVSRAWGELNGFNCSLSANEPQPPAEVQFSVFSSKVATNS